MILVFFFLSVILSCLPLTHSAVDRNISGPICPENFSCPGLVPFKYPFYNVTDTRCGLIKVNCTSTGGEIQFGGRPYEVIRKFDIDYHSSILFLLNNTFEKLVKNNSCEALTNNIISRSPSPLLYSISLYSPITLFKCTNNVTYFEQHNYKSYKTCEDHTFYYNYWNRTVPSDLRLLQTCQVVQLPMKPPESPETNETDIFSLLSPDAFISFNLSHSCSECWKKGRLCDTKNGHDVHCFEFIKDKPGTKQTSIPYTVTVLGISFGVGFVTLSVVIILCFRRKIKMRKDAKYNVKVEMFLKNHEFLVPKRYSYAQVEKITSSFKVKLGKGGFGTVYKGVLRNQNQVAVKVLNEVKSNGEDFINEVASVGRTSHVNIVSLMGFCLEGRQRALIYEFMPNGSLERFINNQGSSSSSQLGWEKLHQIAIGIARGLEYLYRGCSTRILHFDIKPHNILLDDDFCPKISDFGMAKLFREKESKISVSHMRGTPGYIAPEIFSRSFGEISHKSDVYSYGMMILEMVGGRKNIEVGVDNTSEIYFPHWIYKKVELHDEQLGLNEIVSEEENKTARKMIIVGLWCIQTTLDPTFNH
ncbi:putative glycerophosphodiester phosphodiesterase, protein kinase RLK-Pelle-LRK10L-2 family [Helianthus annuus]|nr:putative glycerophosphodiester phosphodiesterase, protein kinase RLK-Pelle-LRK10L-2 family [Helianthus annuus]